VGCSCIFWNPSTFDNPSFIVGCYYDQKKGNIKDLLQIYIYNEKQKDYINAVNLYSENGHKNNIVDVEWAPQLGRSFHLIATSSVDKKLIIWKLKFIYPIENTTEKEKENENDIVEEKVLVKYEDIFTFEPANEVINIVNNVI